MAVQGGGLETVCRLCRTCEDFPAKQRPDLSGTGRSRLAGKVTLHGGHDKSPKQAKQKYPGKGKHGPADAGRCFSVLAQVNSVRQRFTERHALSLPLPERFQRRTRSHQL